MANVISVGSPVEEIEPDGKGRFGAIAHNASGKNFGITVWNAIRPKHRRLFFRTTFSSLCALAIEREKMAPDPDPVGVRLLGLADPDRLLDQRVRCLISRDNEYSGAVVAIRSRVHLKERGTNKQFFGRDLLEVKFDEVTLGRMLLQPLKTHDAGALFVDAADRAIGLLLAHNQGAVFVAPLKPFFDSEGLLLGATEPACDIAVLNSDSSARFRRGLEVMFEDLEEEPRLELDLEAA